VQNRASPSLGEPHCGQSLTALVYRNAVEHHITTARDVTSVERIRVGLLGLNAWIVVYLVPTVHLGMGDLLSTLLALAPLALLALGLGSLQVRPDVARGALLVGFPPALGLAAAARPDLVARGIVDPLSVGLGAASLLAFVAFAARACVRPDRTKPATAQEGRAREPVVEPASRRWLRRILLAVSALGAAAVVGVAPVAADRAALAERWGDALDDALVLAVVVASVASAFALGAIVGPALRAERKSSATEARRRRRASVSIVLAMAAGAAWAVLGYLDANP